VFVVRYAAEQIINWKIGRVDGRSALTMVALREEVAAGEPAEAGTTNAVDEFEHEMVEQIRVLKLERSEDEDEGRERGRVQCVVEIWREVEEGKTREWRMIERRVPLRLGKPLPLIPFVFHGPRHSLPHIEKLPLADMIMVNLDHYRLDADYKHGLHFTALPTAWVSGFDKGATLRIGSSTAWVSETIGAQAGFLEFTGQGLTTFERAMDRDERLMAVLGSRMLEESRRVGEAAQTVELRQSAEHGVLMTLALSLSDSISQVLRWVYWWNSTESSPEVIGEDLVLLELNTDFSVKGMEAKDITAVVAAWQKGAISQETMFDLFRRGEVLPAGRTDEEEARLTARSPKSEVRSASSTTDDAD
jgi:hypothetical protein